jgi:hypothetical protein
MSNNYLLIDVNNVVQNVIVYDGVSEYTPPDGLELAAAPDDIFVGIGHVRQPDGTFIAPVQTDTPATTSAQVDELQARIDELQALLNRITG